MLVLSRMKNEAIVINENIVVTVIELRGDKVRLGIESPKAATVHRREVWEALKPNGAEIALPEGVVTRSRINAADQASEPNSSPSQPPISGLPGGGGRTGETEQNDRILQATVERLTRERDQLSDKYHRVLDDLINAKRELLGLRDALADSDKTNIRMVEYYEGVVRHCDVNEVVVAYEVENDVIEQTYQRDQFIDGNLPELSDHLSVLVRVASLRPDRQIETDGEAEWVDDDGEPLSREF
jgi:carbon storage regulator